MGERSALLLLVLWGALLVEADRMLVVPDLGRRLTIGSLYDARSHLPLTGYLWQKSLIESRTTEKPARFSEYSYAYDDKFSSKANLLDLGLEMSLSLMSGKIQIEGAAKILNQKKTRTRSVRMSLAHKLRTVKQTIDPFADEMVMGMNRRVITDGLATHVVTGVTWGANSIYELEAPYTDKDEKSRIGIYLKLNLDLGAVKIGIKTNITIMDELREYDNRTTLKLYGDVIPPRDMPLPTTPEEGTVFVRKLHTLSLGGEGRGVPVTLELTPLSVLDNAAAQLVDQISGELLERAIAAYETLDASEDLILDMLAINEGPFTAWREDAEKFYLDFLRKRTNFSEALADAVSIVRNGSLDITAVTAVLDDYYASSINEVTIGQFVEAKRDSIENLLALVENLRDSEVTLAESFSDFSAPTFSNLYDRVYVLVIVGMIPSSDREAIGRIREFAALSEGRYAPDSGIRGVTHCVKRRRKGQSAATCVENLKFVAIHFDSFCNEFCPARYCPLPGKGVQCPMDDQCTVFPGVQESLGCWVNDAGCDKNDPKQNFTRTTPISACWCACPKTMVLEYVNSRSAERADHMPLLPKKPLGVTVSGGDEAEVDPLNQAVTLHINPLQDLGVLRNFQVRVLWYEAEKAGGFSLTWVQRERLMETRDGHRDIIVDELTAGERYKFQVAGVNTVGTGPWSDIFPDTDMYASHNTPMISPHSIETRHSATPVNVLPGWGTFDGVGKLRVNIDLSVAAREVVGKVEFHHEGVVVFKCEQYYNASEKHIECTVPIRDAPVTQDTNYVAVVKGLSGDVVAWGNVTMQGPATRSCYDWEMTRFLLCDTQIERVEGAQDVELSPLDQRVTLHLNGSLHERDLVRFRVRVLWKEAGKLDEQQRSFDTYTDVREIIVRHLAAGQLYQFQVAGVDSEGNDSPYSPRFPPEGVFVAYNMPIIVPITPTSHLGQVANVLPAWFLHNSGKLRVNVSLSTVGDEPIARVSLHEDTPQVLPDSRAPIVRTPAAPVGLEPAPVSPGGGDRAFKVLTTHSKVVQNCSSYGNRTTAYTTCTFNVGTLMQATSKLVLVAKVWGVNGNLLAKMDVKLLLPAVETCVEWETTSRMLCNLTTLGGGRRCVEKCDECSFNGEGTSEFSGECSTVKCPVGQVWCPNTEVCFHAEATPDAGCRWMCAEDSVYTLEKRICAVPCRIDSLGLTVPPGTAYPLSCAKGSVWSNGAASVNFTCPVGNSVAEEIDEKGNVAPWAPKEVPSCRRCGNEEDCSGNALEVTSSDDRMKCLCVCKEGFTGAKCDACAAGYVRYPYCFKCKLDCSGNGAGVTSDADRATCQCQCKEGYTGDLCSECDVGYSGFPSCERCSTAKHCNGHATGVTSEEGECACTCKEGYTGKSCDRCASGYRLYPLCIGCNSVKDCNGHADSVSTTFWGQCRCQCSERYTGSTCDQCAAGYGNYPRCTKEWEVEGSKCPAGTVMTHAQWAPKRCLTCTTSDDWHPKDVVPTCKYSLNSLLGFVFVKNSICVATSVVRVRCKAITIKIDLPRPTPIFTNPFLLSIR